MITTLQGKISERLLDTVVLEVNGVGYGVLVTNEDLGQLHLDQPAKLYIYEHIRESAYDLYGFLSLDTKRLFEQLLGVNGVGPKMALSVLSVGASSYVRSAIAEANVKYIQQASGVGKRVAERIVVDLKDKVGLTVDGSSFDELLAGQAAESKDEATQALMALGYSLNDAVQALRKVDAGLPTEERVKIALRNQ